MIQRSLVNFLAAFGVMLLMFFNQSIVYAESQHYPVAWAMNLGGDQYLGADGIQYLADADKNGKSGTIKAIRGAQEQMVFSSYRVGDLDLAVNLENGRYTVTLLFAEPDDLAIGDRIFDVQLQGETKLADFDIVQARGGNPRSAVVRSVPNVNVTDGTLTLALTGKKGVPVLNAVVVRLAAQPSWSSNTDWKLVWADEFDYQGAPDPTKWSYNLWPAGKVNQELQTYTDHRKNVRVNGGRLIIQAHKESFNNAEYTSGRIHSANKGDILYGRVEVKAKLPAGQGTWPAIWMMPTDAFRYATTCSSDAEWEGSAKCDAWPNSGEIDIMEHVGYDMNRVHGTVHTKAYYWVNGEQRQATIEADSVDQSFHTYALEWSPQRMDIFYDNQPYFTYLNQGEGWQAWPFDHPYHVILNLAVGGNWGAAGGPVDDSVMPATLEVEYVRFYQRDDSSEGN